MQMFCSIYFVVALMNIFFYCNHLSSLFYYLDFVGSLETFLMNLSSVWDIFHVGVLASYSAPFGCNNKSIAVVKL